MADLSTRYLGLMLKSPLIVGSCDLTNSLDNLKEIEKNGAGAVVLKSIFEEEILNEANLKVSDAEKNNLIYSDLSETLDYMDLHIKEKNLGKYLTLIRDAKKKLFIPVIASINCISDYEWDTYAVKIQDAGADALELNIFHNPTGFDHFDYEKQSLQIIKKIVDKVKIPVAVKLSSSSSNLGSYLLSVSKSGVAGMVLFNRFYTPDFDIENFKFTSESVYSTSNEYLNSLRWIALISDKVNCSLAASTGIHHGNSAIKQLLAGADAFQVVSSLYLKGLSHINTLNSEIEKWMEKKSFNTIDQFRGKLSYSKTSRPEMFERMQFMKYFGKIE